MTKLNKIILNVILFIPLILMIVWIIYIKVTENAGAGLGSFLSPIDNTSIISFLTIFVSGYLFFLGVRFFSNIKVIVVKKLKGY